MELRHLRYFVAVADKKHFRHAAEALFISQPALSQQIQQLEEELGQPLFDRSGKKVALTPAGALFQQYAQRALHEMDEAKVALGELQDVSRGKICIGVVQTVNAYFLPEWIAAFSQKYPAIALQVEELSADEIEEGIFSGRLNIGVAFVPTYRAGLDVEPLFEEDFVLAVPENHRLALRASLTLSELEKEPLLMLSRDYCTRRLFDQAMSDAGGAATVRMEMNSISTILATVRRGGLPTVLPRLALRNQPGIKTVALTDPTPRRGVGLIWRQGGFRCTACSAFAQCMRENLSV